MPRRSIVVALLLVLSGNGRTQTVDFGRDIKPIFESRCYSCHGPQKQKNSLRLDVKIAALAGGDSGKAIIAGKSADSPLYQRVTSAEKFERMPPSGAALTKPQIALLQRWIDQGAPWPDDGTKVRDKRDWWSYQPIVKPRVPQITGKDWGRNGIDAFILAKLKQLGLAPSHEADRRTLIRRVYFDLIGLPPTPTEVDAFVADPDPHAYEKLVDRLLGSPQLGERWARHWLDVVHYGDTHGYDKDKPRRNAWPYRDYVIRAFNSDKPYSRFVQEQIAGDILFPGTVDGIVATGFIAAGPWDFIGHAEVPESKMDGQIARVLDRDDMVSNTFNTFLSMTVQCARCHNHKFDPVTQLDYYRLQAVFAALDRTERVFDADPKTATRRSELEANRRKLHDKKTQLEKTIAERGGAELAVLDKAIAAAAKPATSARSLAFGYHSQIESTPDKVKWVQVDLGKASVIDTIIYVGCHDDFNNIGAGFGFPLRFKIELSDDPQFRVGVNVVLDRTSEDVANPGVAAQKLDVHGKLARYVRVTATKLAPRMNDFILALAELQVLDREGANVARNSAVTSLDSIEAPPRWGKQNLVDGYYFGVGSGGRDDSLASLRQRRDELLRRKVDATTRDELKATAVALDEVARSIARLPAAQFVYAGAIHTGSGSFSGTGPSGGRPRDIRLLMRGDIRTPGDRVEPGTVPLKPGDSGVFALPASHNEGERRAALARWITDPHNPLAWRSIVNRIWQYHFGRGIVDTPNDFGHMGQQPSHPDLLDWLAAEFRDGRQSLKDLQRLIVTSATYRQSSATNVECARKDASNVYLWRMNRRRLEAEAVRDAALAIAGKLSPEMGGPGFQDFVIEKPEHSPHYEYHLHDPENPSTHRRSIYRFIVRSQPQPFMTTLDCADPSMSVDKRNETLTSLQALALLNNRFMLVMAQHMAARIERIAATPEEQVAAAFRLALGRRPTRAEREAVEPYRIQYGLANTCRVLMNLNEFSFVD